MTMTARDYILSHLWFTAHLGPSRKYVPTAEEEQLISQYCSINTQFKKARGKNRLSLARDMDAILAKLELSADQRRAIIKDLDSFQLFCGCYM